MKRYNGILEQVYSFENLLKAYQKASKGKQTLPHVQKFYWSLERNLLQIKHELMANTYAMQPYTTFTIYDPKMRNIAAPKFKDHVVAHAIFRIIEPLLDKRFIYDSYASRKNKGLLLAIKRTQSFCLKSQYYLKIDIDNYFATIDHDILITLLTRYFKDKNFVFLVERILSNFVPYYEPGKGLALGNILSQVFANFYLNLFDHHIQNKIKYYVRYMDDMVFFSDEKQKLHDVLSWINTYFEQVLQVRIKDRITILSPTFKGVPFLGFFIFPRHIRLRNSALRRARKTLKKIRNKFICGEIDDVALQNHLNGFCEHLKIADSYQLRQNWLAHFTEEDNI